MDKEDIYSYHYKVNHETHDGWMDRMNEGKECMLCKVEQDCNKDGQLRHTMEDNERIAHFALNLMPPFGFKTWSREAIQCVLRECESD